MAGAVVQWYRSLRTLYTEMHHDASTIARKVDSWIVMESSHKASGDSHL